MLEQLKSLVCNANLDLVAKGVVIYTWGNVSGISDDRKYMIIKPSGVNYDGMSAADMVVVDIESGETMEGKWKPSSDTKTHLELYKRFPEIKGIVHTHSTNAVAFAQAGINIPALGTTHADYFYGDIPCTRELSKDEVMEAYELNTGKVIIETIEKLGYDPMAIPGIVVKNHGPFAWGTSPANAVYNAVVMEKVAEMDIKTLLLNPQAEMKQYVLDKHYMRKHGPNAYYVENEMLDDFKKITCKALNFVFLIASPLVVYFIIFAKESVFFLSGDSYAGAIIPMQIIMPTVLFIGITNLLGIQILVPLGKEKMLLYSAIVGAIVDFIINAICIPQFASADAAIGTVVAEFSVLVVQYMCLRKEIHEVLSTIHFWWIWFVFTCKKRTTCY